MVKIFQDQPFSFDLSFDRLGHDFLDRVTGRQQNSAAPQFSPNFGQGAQYRIGQGQGPNFQPFGGGAPNFRGAGDVGSPFSAQPQFSPFPGTQNKPTALPGTTGGTGGSTPGEGWGVPDTTAIDKQLGARGTRNAAISAQDVASLSQQYGVPTAVVLAILNQESGYGTDQNTLTQNNNFMGLTGTGDKGSVTLTGSDGKVRTFAAFSSPRAGLEAGIRNMAGGQYQNLTLRQYLALYLTGDVNGADDGSGNTTSSYVTNALAIVRALGGSASVDSVVIRPASAATAQPPSPQRTQQVLASASTLLGTPYLLGGRRANGGDPTRGVDCSEFTAWAYERVGVKLPWNAQQQYNATARVDYNNLQPGDLVFFRGTDPNDPDPITHVGIYVGNGRFINAQDSGVAYGDLTSDYWRTHYAGAGRVA